MFRIADFLSGFVCDRLMGAGILAVGFGVSALPAAAGQLASGQTFFEQSPVLLRVSSSQPAVNSPATYQFTLKVPENAGAPLQAVTISQAVNPEYVQFDVSDSRAFTGNKYARGSELALANVGGSAPSSAEGVTIVFEKPVQPGSTVTIGLDVNSNPTVGGNYLFGVTAYPAGEKGLGQFLGYRPVVIYSNSQ